MLHLMKHMLRELCSAEEMEVVYLKRCQLKKPIGGVRNMPLSRPDTRLENNAAKEAMASHDDEEMIIVDVGKYYKIILSKKIISQSD